MKRQGRLEAWKKTIDARSERDGNGPLSQDMSEEELTADATGDAMTDPDFLRQLAQRKPGTFASLADSFMRYLDRVISKFSNLGSSQYLEDVQAFREVLLDVLTEVDPKTARRLESGDVMKSRRGWGQDFPDAVLGYRPGALAAHADYAAAKAGGDVAALRLARDLVSDEFVRAVRKAIPQNETPIIVPVLAVEEGGKNRIPLAAARVLANRLGLEVEEGIVQAQRVGRGGSDGMERIARQPTFKGKVRSGQTYIILDDTLTQGGTLAQLKTHIEDNGGKVLLATALSGKDYSRKLGIEPRTLDNLRERYADLEPFWRDTFGYGFEGLTESEARFLLKLKGRPTADAIRDRISAIRDETVQPVDEASDRVGAVSDSVVEQEQFAAGERDSDPGDPVFSRKSVNDVAATAKTARAIFTDLNKQLRNNIRNAERMRELGKEANELIGLVSTSPDYDQMLRDLSKDLTPEKRAILSGDKGPAGDRIRDALAEYDRIREEMRLAADDRRKVRLMAAEANRALDKLQRMEDKMSLADREQLIAQIDPIVETAMRVYERAKKIRDFRRAKQWAIIQAQKNRIETMNRLAAEGYPQGSITWSSLNDRWDGVKGYLRKLRKQFQDRMNSVRYTQEDIEASMGQPLEDFLNVYRRENLMHGRAADEIDQLYRQRIEPLKQFLRDNKIDQADFERYLIARHAKERNERIASINPQMPDGGSGLLTAEAQAILTEFQQRGLTAKLDDAARQVDRLRRWTLRHLRDGGQITDEMHNKLDGMYQFYVPLRGKKGEDEASRPSGRGTGGGIDTRGNPIQRALGRGEGNLPDNILAEMLGDAERAILQVEKARVGQTLLRLALEAPNPDVWVVEPVELEYKYSESTGEVYLGIKNDMADPETVIVKHKGKPYRVRLKDPQLAEAIKNLGVDSHAWVAENIGWINRYFSAVNTRYNPGFVPVNMLRDMTQGVIGLVAEHDLRTAATVMAHWHDAAHGLWLDARRDPGSQTHPWAVWAREFAEVGGKTGYMVFQNVEDIQARIDSDLRSFGELVKSGKPIAAIQSKLRNSSFIELIEDVNDVVENAMRLSTYATLRQKGVSKEKAAEYAKNLTVNFNRKGQAASLMNSLFLFFNAAVQGSHRVGKLLMNRKTQGIVAGMAGVQMVMAIVGMRMKGDDDDESAWEKIPEHVKQRSLVIPLSSDGDYFSLPMPYGFNFFTWMGGYLPNLGNRHWRERNTPGEMTNMAGKAMLNAFSPVPIDEGGMGLIPHVLKIPVNVAMNENDWGNKITMDQPFSKYDMPRSAFGRNDTSALFSYTSKLLNRIGGGDDFTPPKTMKWLLDRSPEDLEYIAEQLGGGLGRSFIKSATFTEKAAAGSDWSGTDIPILSALFGRVNAKSIQSELFYDHRDDIERSAARVRSAYKNAADEALRESGYPETVVNGYIEGGRTGAERAAARLQMDDPEGVSNELGEISRIAGEPAATQMIAELGLLADGITFSRRKDGRLSESSSGTPELTGEEGSIFALYKEVSKDLGDMKDQRMAIESNDKLGPLEKRQRLDAIKIAEAGAMSRLNRYWRDISDRYAARSQ